MGIVRMGPPVRLVLELARDLQVATFVETGTYHGDTAVWAAHYFARVFSVESSEAIMSVAVARTRALTNVELQLGDSREFLRKLVPRLEGPAVFWLDSHWSGVNTAGVDDQCPLLEELAIIAESLAEHVVLIDDARLFLAPPPPPLRVEAWPRIDQVIAQVRSRPAPPVIAITEDVFIAVPARAQATVIAYCQEVAARDWAEYGRLVADHPFRRGVRLGLRGLSLMGQGLRVLPGQLIPSLRRPAVRQ